MKLISAETYREAAGQAANLDLNPEQWVYIPLHPANADIRQRKLKGMRAKPEDLVGKFSPEERANLLKKENENDG